MSRSTFNAQTAKDTNLIGNKIAELRKDRKLKQNDLVDLLADYGMNLQQTSIAKWETGATTPSAYHFIALCLALDVSDPISEFGGSSPALNAILNEKGIQKLYEYRDLLVASGQYKPQIKEFKPRTKTVRIPTSYIKAAAGVGNFLDEENFEDREYPENVVPAGTDYALFVDGNSMSPIYVDGQIAYVKKCQTIQPGQVGIFSIDNEVVIKIYEEQEPDESIREEFTDSNGIVHPQVVLCSFNSEWKPRPISPYQEFHVYGRVLN